MTRSGPVVRHVWLGTAILLIAAFALIRHANDLSMWYDEVWTIFHSTGTLEQIVRDRDLSWPPGYYLLLHAWIKLLGMNDFVVRVLNVLSGMMGTACMIQAGRALSSDRAGWLAGLAFGVSGYAVYFLLEVRGYGLMLTLTAALVCLHARWLKVPTWRRAIPIALVQALLLYTRYADSMAIVVLLGLHVLLSARRLLGRWLLIGISTGLLFVPMLPDFWDFYLSRRAAHVENPDPGIFLRGPELWFQSYSRHQDALWTILLTLALAGVGLALRRGGRQTRLTVLWLALWGVGIPAFIYANRESLLAYTPRYLLFTLPAFMWLIGTSLAHLPRPAMAAGATLLLVSLALPWHPFDFRRPYTSGPPVRDLVRELAVRFQPGDALLVDPKMPPTMEEPYDWWYYEKLYFPGGRLPRISEASEAGPRVWLLVRQGSEDEVTRRQVEQGRIATEFWGPWYFIATLYEGPPLSPGVRLGDSLRFRGATLESGTLYRPGDTLALETWWSVDSALEADYSLGLHLVNRKGMTVAQADSGPLGPYTPGSTSQWQPGEVYRDDRQVRIPWCLPKGRYEVRLVVYTWWDGARLAPEEGAWRGPEDSIQLGSVVVGSYADCD